MGVPPRLTTVAACRVAGLHRDRFNEHVAAGNFDCAPKTVAGRGRLFDKDAVLALSLFKRNLDDGMNAERAGAIACAVAQAAAQYPDERAVGYLETFIGLAVALPASQLADPNTWSAAGGEGVVNSGTTIRKVTVFNVAHLRALIDHGFDEEAATFGEPDE
jgi:hypothetical protein